MTRVWFLVPVAVILTGVVIVAFVALLRANHQLREEDKARARRMRRAMQADPFRKRYEP